ncbi:uncharacterized protein LOC119766078 [Culex quinquefasciatus]|uniref:uncharacterized protein LOC119766078 n=1 Tax=Culex quinquefasciatus TaxID=7176 RepID=UPI0018E368FD|nr:uncharacterized protein LOC119766078 [Culex quinquefasciatus]
MKLESLKNGDESLVVVEFALKSARDEVYSAYMRRCDLKLRHLGLNSDRRVYINENLDTAAPRETTDAARFTDSATSPSGSKEALPTPNGPDCAVYAMNGSRRGKVLIFNHFKFDEREKDEKSLEPRHGTDEDVKTLRETLPKLGFLKDDIKEFKDRTKKEIWEATEELRNDADLKNSDCLMNNLNHPFFNQWLGSLRFS